MKITNHGCIDSGAGRQGFLAYKKGYTWSDAVARWQSYKRNSLWIKSALKAYREAGGYVPGKEIK